MSAQPTSCPCCPVFVGLSGVQLLSLEELPDESLRMTIETMASIVGCPGCGVIAESKCRSPVALADLPCLGRQTTTVWVKRRFRCNEEDCPARSWTEVDDEIAPPRSVLTTRGARWATFQVGAHARSVSEVAKDLGCDWHPVNDAVIACGTELLDADPRWRSFNETQRSTSPWRSSAPLLAAVVR